MANEFFKLPDKILGIELPFLKMFLVPVGVLLLFVISFNLVISPRFSAISDVNKSIESVNKQTELTKQKINYLSSVDQDQIKKDVSYLENAVLQEKNSYLLLDVVKNVANKYGFAVSSFSVSSIEVKNGDNDTLKVADKDVASKLPLNVTLYGDNSKRLELIAALESTLPIMFIDSLEMSSAGGFANLNMIISSYYIADKSDSVSGNLTLNDLIPTQEENDLLKTISGFNTTNTTTGAIGETSAFVKYDRSNPFTL